MINNFINGQTWTLIKNILKIAPADSYNANENDTSLNVFNMFQRGSDVNFIEITSDGRVCSNASK